MCGFAGILEHRAPAREADAVAMAREVSHRGPDGSGSWSNGPVALAHHRLAIIDPTDAGAQPLHWQDDRFTLVFNGEIYNAPELRQELIGEGDVFLSLCDTEVLLHLVGKYGLDGLERVDGMFAFALWDRDEKELLLVRDRLGIKPLFYHQSGDRFSFGSEMAAILATPGLSREPDWEAIKELLRLNYVIAPKTGLKSVRQMLPGQALRVRPGTEPRLETWWQSEREERNWSWGEALEAFEQTLLRAVQLRTRSDVGYGLLLSGGMDSAAIGAALQQLGESDCAAFTIGFQDPRFDEIPLAAATARHLGLEHHVARLGPETLERLPEWVRHTMEPTADASMLAYGALTELASAQRKVVLGGDGADEILAGYSTYPASLMARRWRQLPRSITGILERNIPPRLPVRYGKVGWEEKTRRFLGGASRGPTSAHLAWREILTEDRIAELAAPNPKGMALKEARSPEALWENAFAEKEGHTFLQKLLHMDQRIYLPNDMLTKVDRISMAKGLEVRVPFLSHHLVDLVASFPDPMKLRRTLRGKGILRRFLKGRVPGAIYGGPKKGFNIPVGAWLRGPCLPFLMDTLSTDRIRQAGFLDEKAVAHLVHRHRDGKEDLGYALFGLLVVQLWWEQIFEG